MVRVVAKMTFDDTTEFLVRIQDLITKSRQESGCIFYDLMQDVEHKNILCFIEEWESKEALDKHFETPHFKDGIKIVERFARDINVSVYQPLS